MPLVYVLTMVCAGKISLRSSKQHVLKTSNDQNDRCQGLNYARCRDHQDFRDDCNWDCQQVFIDTQNEKINRDSEWCPDLEPPVLCQYRDEDECPSRCAYLEWQRLVNEKQEMEERMRPRREEAERRRQQEETERRWEEEEEKRRRLEEETKETKAFLQDDGVQEFMGIEYPYDDDDTEATNISGDPANHPPAGNQNSGDNSGQRGTKQKKRIAKFFR